jgi:hypothetical protein
MAYIAYLYKSADAVPYMEPIADDDLLSAEDTLRRLLAQHASARFAELWEGDERILTIAEDGRLL